MLGGGPASQHPQLQSQQIRGVLPRAVTSPSSRYPQLICVLMRFFTKMPSAAPFASFASCLTMPQRAALFINLKPRRGLAEGGESPLSGADATCRPRQRGLSLGETSGSAGFGALCNRGDGTAGGAGLAMLSGPTLWPGSCLNFLWL